MVSDMNLDACCKRSLLENRIVNTEGSTWVCTACGTGLRCDMGKGRWVKDARVIRMRADADPRNWDKSVRELR